MKCIAILQRFFLRMSLFSLLLIPSISLPQGQWEQINPKPTGSFFRDVFVFDSNTAIVLTGAFIMKTDDGGEGWEKINVTKTLSSITALDFANATTGWIIGHEVIYKTTDGGISWQPLQGYPVGNLRAVEFVDSDLGWVVGNIWGKWEDGTILQTMDGGLTWKETTVSRTGSLEDVFFIDGQYGWAVGRHAMIARTVDRGASWEVIDTGLDAKLLSVSFVNTNCGWIIGEKSNDQGYGTHFILLETDDGGLTWGQVTIDFEGRSIESVFFSDSTTGWLTGWNGTIYNTTDAGASWQLLDKLTQENLLGIHFFDGTYGWIVGTRGTLIKTENSGASWHLKSESFTSSSLNSVYFVNNEIGWTVGDDGALFRTEDGGADWQPIDSGTTNDLLSLFFIDSDTGWVSGKAGTLLNTTDGGTTWNVQPLQPLSYYWITDLEFYTSNFGWALADFETVIMTEDGGETWLAMGSFTPYIQSLQFVTDQVGWLVGDDGIFKTIDGGADWQRQTTGLNPDEGVFYNFVQFLDVNHGWILGGKHANPAYIIKTSDGGASWQEVVKDSLTEIRTAYFSDKDTGWAWGLFMYYTNDSGVSWHKDLNILEEIRDIHFLDNTHGWAVGYAGSIFRYTSAGPVTIEDQYATAKTPSQIRLSHNYPNPFNPETAIRFKISEPTHVTLTIYDLLGREVRTLVNERRSTGHYSVAWNGRDNAGRTLASGVYMYKLDAGNSTVIKKMVFVK